MPSLGVFQATRRHFPLLVGAVLVGLLVVWLLLQIHQWRELTEAPIELAHPQATTSDTTPGLERLGILFGAPVGNVSADDMDTETGIVLRGSFVNADPQRSVAILQADNGNPERYRPGDEIRDGVRLQAVYADRVEVRHDGEIKTLRFPPLDSSENTPPLPDTSGAPELALPPPDTATSPPPTEGLQEQMDTLRQQLEQSGSEPPNGMPTE